MKSTGTSRKPKPPVLHRLIRDMSSEAYHGSEGTWSSSQLKDIIDDEETFVKKYITKEIPKKSSNTAFDVGNYVHTSVLEPHKVRNEYTVYNGRAWGKEFDKFKKKNAGKVVLSNSSKAEGDRMIKAINESTVAKKYLVGEPEVSLFIKLVVCEGEIYAPNYNKKLTINGWIDFDFSKVKGKKHEFIFKVRSDTLGKKFISDIKSTSGQANKKESVRNSISKYKYDLSAALYLDLFSLEVPTIKRFVWIFASKSKDSPTTGTWKATPKNVLVGRAKWMYAIIRMAQLQEMNWQIYEEVGELEPLPHELEWLERHKKQNTKSNLDLL